MLLEFKEEEEIFQDQRMVLAKSKTSRFPSLEIVKIPELLFREMNRWKNYLKPTSLIRKTQERQTGFRRWFR